MSIFSHLIRSLLLTMVFSFLTPLLVMAVGLISFDMMSHLPLVESMGKIGSSQIVKFLSTFGTGHPLQGSLVIAITFSLVGGLFDTYATYHHHRIS